MGLEAIVPGLFSPSRPSFFCPWSEPVLHECWLPLVGGKKRCVSGFPIPQTCNSIQEFLSGSNYKEVCVNTGIKLRTKVTKLYLYHTVVNLFYGDVIFFCFDIEMRSYTDKHFIFTKKNCCKFAIEFFL